MSDLLEHILNENYAGAGELVESRLNDIVEKKLYEKKRMMQAEAFGGLTPAEIQARKDAGYMKAADFFALKDAVAKQTKSLQKGTKRLKAQKKVVKEASDPKVITPAMRRKQLGLGALEKSAREYSAAKTAATGEEPATAPTKARKAPPAAKAQPAAPAGPKVDVAGKMSQTGGRAPEVKVSAADKAVPDQQKSRRERLAQKGLKMLKAKSAGEPLEKRYDSAIKSAKELELRGRQGAVSKVKWSKGGMKARAGRELRNYGSAMGSFAKGIIGGLGEDTE